MGTGIDSSSSGLGGGSVIYNLDLSGEDRHFCIRAAALGLELFADTQYHPFHIYRESDLAALQEYKQKLTAKKAHRKNTITLAMLVRNEADRYLERILKHAVQYIDRAVILDDASEDNTVEICRKVLKGIPLTLVTNQKSYFHNEIILRKQLWDMVVSSNPEWIIVLDADEIFEDKAPQALQEIAERSDRDYYAFRLYDMWDEGCYREDTYWSAHLLFRPFMVRYVPEFDYVWQETPQHCGRFPHNVTDLNGKISPLRTKHLGWIKPADRLQKYNRYKKLDPNAIYGNKEQYDTILDPRPNLIPWSDIEGKQE